MLIVVVSIIFVLFLTFGLIFFLKKLQISYTKYGNKMQCDNIGDVLWQTGRFENEAFKDYLGFEDEGIPMTGVLNCFCKEEHKNSGGFWETYDKVYTSSVVKRETDPDSGIFVAAQAPLCQDWVFDQFYMGVGIKGIGFTINIVNLIAGVVIRKLIVLVGYSTKSLEIKAIKNALFYTQFFNTALVLMIVNANFIGFGGLPDNFFTRGEFNDFSLGWYESVGSALVYTMIICAVWPIIEFVVFFGIKLLLRLLDYLLGKCRTAKKTIPSYVRLYGGSEYLIFWKYS